ncbi:queuosine precursor transporter [Candidatus Dojkabacteria bacterium]|nr:queuosine precursor transporter [Candidatus Dojkabacteria bacterium]
MFKKINKLDFLVACYIACLFIAEILGSKTFPLIKIFGYQFTASVGIFVFPLLFTINDIISEVYGKDRAKSVLYSSLIMIVFLFLFSLFAVSLPVSDRFHYRDAYDIIFMKSARICIASLSAFIISGFIDIHIFHKLKNKLKGKMLWFRNNASNILSQFIDTTVFMTIAFYASNEALVDNINFLIGIIIPYWLLKCLMSIIETPLVYLGVKWIKYYPKNHNG